MSIFTQGLEIEFKGISKRYVEDLFHVNRFYDMPLSNLLRVELEHAESIEVIFPPLVYYANGNKTKTAELLGIALTTLYRKIEEYQIK